MSVISDLLNKGELPKVNVDVRISKQSMVDLAATAVIAAMVIVLLNKLIFSKL